MGFILYTIQKIEMKKESSENRIIKQRNSSIELLRIISIIGVVILHYNNGEIGGGFKYVNDGSFNQYYLFFTENMFICAVNLFMLISAYFLSTTNNRKLIKIVELIVQVIVFKIVVYVLTVIGGSAGFSLKSFVKCLLPANYFVILYSVVYVVSPYINIMLDKLNRESFKRLLITLVFVFSIWTISVDFLENASGVTINGLSTVGIDGSQCGYTIVNFVLIYIIGAYIKRNDVNISIYKSLFGILVSIAIMFGTSLVEDKLGFSKICTWNYNNPFVILLSVCIFLLFLNIQFNNKAINELAKGAFTCFLFHGLFMKYLGIEKIVNENILILIAHQVGVAVILYLISYVVYKVYYLCSHWFIKLLVPLCDKVNISL